MRAPPAFCWSKRRDFFSEGNADADGPSPTGFGKNNDQFELKCFHALFSDSSEKRGPGTETRKKDQKTLFPQKQF
jgi:hypothetical protein